MCACHQLRLCRVRYGWRGVNQLALSVVKRRRVCISIGQRGVLRVRMIARQWSKYLCFGAAQLCDTRIDARRRQSSRHAPPCTRNMFRNVSHTPYLISVT